MTSCSTLMGKGLLHTSGAASPWPSWPYSFEPHANTSLLVMHTVCSSPHATLLQARIHRRRRQHCCLLRQPTLLTRRAAPEQGAARRVCTALLLLLPLWRASTLT
jgi:hypothetical protein